MARKVKFGDREISVPDDTTDQELEAILGAPKQGTQGFENLRTTGTPELKPGVFNPKTPPAPYLSNLGANALPAIGSTFGPGGTMIGTGVSQILKREFPKVFGDPADSVPIEGVKDLIVNNAIPAGIGSVFRLAAKGLRALPASAPLRNFPAVRQGAAQQMSEQIASQFAQPESQILRNAARHASEGIGTGEFQPIKINPGQEYQPLTKGKSYQPRIPPSTMPSGPIRIQAGENEIGQKLALLDKEFQAGADISKSQTFKEITKLATSDPIYAQNFKLAAGQEAFDALAVNKLIEKGGVKGALNAEKILAELKGGPKEVYEQISPEILSNFRNMINEIHAQQTGHGISDAVVRFSGNKLLWTALGIGHTLGFHMAASPMTLAAGGTVLTNSMLAKAMSNPETARVVVEALRTPAASQKGQIISHILENVWKGGAAIGQTESER